MSRRLVDGHDVIVHEQLPIANLVRRPAPRPDGKGGFEPNGAAAKAGLNREILAAGWGLLLRMIAYKAEEAGRQVIAVNPRYTSQTCAHCDHVEEANRHLSAFDVAAAATATTPTSTPPATSSGPGWPIAPSEKPYESAQPRITFSGEP